MMKVFSESQMAELFTYLTNKINEIEVYNIPKLKPLDECNAEDVAGIINAYYLDVYTKAQIQEVWSVGDKITIPVKQMNAFSESLSDTHAAQDITLILTAFEQFDFSQAYKGKTKPLVLFSMQDCLNEKGKGHTSTAGTQQGWKNNPRREWCNTIFKNALPSSISSGIKTIVRPAWPDGSWSTVENVDDQVFIPNQREFGNDEQPGNLGPTWSYYNSDLRRKKKVNGSYDKYFTSQEAAYSGSDIHYYCTINSDGGFDMANRTSLQGLTMAFCM